MGVDVVMTWDHFFPLSGDNTGGSTSNAGSAGAWAEQTERVELGALVTGGGYRNPDLLADIARTVDHISGGRLFLGIGAGWFEKDYEEYGYEFGTPGSRLRLLGEYLPRITHRLGELDPPPVRDIPIMIGGGGEKKTLRLVAEYGDIWHAFGDLETLVRKAGVLNGHCADVGRDPAAIEYSTQVSRYSETEADSLVDEGFTLLTLSAGGPDYDLSSVPGWLAWRDARNGRPTDRTPDTVRSRSLCATDRSAMPVRGQMFT